MVYKVRVKTDILKSKQARGYRVRRRGGNDGCEGPLGEDETGGRSSRQEQGHSGCRAGRRVGGKGCRGERRRAWRSGRQWRSGPAWKVEPTRFPWLGGGAGGQEKSPGPLPRLWLSIRRKGVAGVRQMAGGASVGKTRSSFLNKREQAAGYMRAAGRTLSFGSRSHRRGFSHELDELSKGKVAEQREGPMFTGRGAGRLRRNQKRSLRRRGP